jgi:hypothetical protein
VEPSFLLFRAPNPLPSEQGMFGGTRHLREIGKQTGSLVSLFLCPTKRTRR